ncbi:MAG: DUF5615 family PIN-like protein [Thermoanaerobaculia bacterium]|nr:DUF5615 family PIN-like protein [Thermoanaerobaculia bacterium]
MPDLAKPRFYLDECIGVRTLRPELERLGMDAVSVQSLGKLGDTDSNHLRRATEEGRVLCTSDPDLLRLAAEGFGHAGIVYAKQGRFGVGVWVGFLRHLHETKTADDLRGVVTYVRPLD